MLSQRSRDHSVGLGERGVDIAPRDRGIGDDGVVTELVEQRRLGRIDRVFVVGDRRQLFVLDLDEVAAVLRLVARLGDHHRHHIADEAHLVGGERIELGELDAEGQRCRHADCTTAACRRR